MHPVPDDPPLPPVPVEVPEPPMPVLLELVLGPVEVELAPPAPVDVEEDDDDEEDVPPARSPPSGAPIEPLQAAAVSRAGQANLSEFIGFSFIPAGCGEAARALVSLPRSEWHQD
jgi:hypothetical protein